MIDYLLMLGTETDLADGEWHSWTHWWTKKLNLLYEDTCNIIYQDKEEIDKWCKDNGITNSTVLCEYVSVVKRVLKKTFLSAVKNLYKRDNIEYDRSYRFMYDLIDHIESVWSSELIDDVLAIETEVCNDMNEDHNLSEKMKGRQLLMLIYGNKQLKEQFDGLCILYMMEDQHFVDVLNNEISHMDFIRGYITEDTPIVQYYENFMIVGIECPYEKDEAKTEALATQITNIIRTKARKDILSRHYTNKWTDETIYLFKGCEKEILKVEKLLFTHFDEDYIVPEKKEATCNGNRSVIYMTKNGLEYVRKIIGKDKYLSSATN